MTTHQAFAEAMRSAGIETTDPITADGRMHRIHIEGDKRGTKNGWYVLHSDGIPAGQFGSWKSGTSQTWCGKSDLSEDERKLYRATIQKQQKAREQAEADLRNEAARRAEILWGQSGPVTDHQYLTSKQIQSHCCRLYKDRLVVPMRDAQGNLRSLQFIGPDGTKRFLSNGQKKGTYATIGKPGDTILIAEGFATGATLHQATGHAIVIAFDAGNLEPVSKVIRDKFPAARIVICGDNDQFTDGNPGVSAAHAAAKPIGATVFIPKFENPDPNDKPTDWNDFARIYGADQIVPKLGTIVPISGTDDITDLSPANDNAPALLSIDTHSPLPDTNDKGRPLTTIENLSEVCRRLGVTIRYNVISKEEEILIPKHGFSIDNQANASLAWLSSWCARFRMPTDKLSDFVTYLADSNPFNPVAEWILSKPWDGVYRLNDLCNTIEATNNDLKCILILRWMVSAVAAAFEPDGVSAHGVLVLQGDQYLGKTKWFKSLVPASLGVIQDGLMLRPDDRDSVKQCVSNWLVELGEIDSTFRKSDIAQLKSFITKKNDVIRRAYARKESNYARRTVFFGSVNPKQYLHDATGNRRFWTIEATKIDHSHDIDMQQLWAEIHHYWKQGEDYYLSPDEMDRLNDHNEEYTVADPIQERIQTQMNWNSDRQFWQWKSATEVLMSLGIERPTQSEVTKAAGFIRDLNGGQSKRTMTARMLLVPNRNYNDAL